MFFKKRKKEIKSREEINTHFNRLSFYSENLDYLLTKEKPEKQKTCLSGYFKNVKGLIRF